MDSHKLNPGQKHLLRLVHKDKKEDGWTPVSSVVWPLMADLPTELVTTELFMTGGGRAKLTQQGEIVLAWF